jgi:hypothetical protein
LRFLHIFSGRGGNAALIRASRLFRFGMFFTRNDTLFFRKRQNDSGSAVRFPGDFRAGFRDGDLTFLIFQERLERDDEINFFFLPGAVLGTVARHLQIGNHAFPVAERIRRDARHSDDFPGAPVDFRIMQGTVFHFTSPFIFQIKYNSLSFKEIQKIKDNDLPGLKYIFLPGSGTENILGNGLVLEDK